MIGYEFEFFAIDAKTKEPINGKQFDQIHTNLAKKGWVNEIDPISNAINYSKKGKIALKTDVILHIFELNMPPKETIDEAHEEFMGVLNQVNEEAKRAGVALLFIGGLPKKIRYCELTRGNDAIVYTIQLKETMSDWYTIAGNHIWLDVEKEELVKTINVYNQLCGIFIALFGNSSVIEEKIQANIEQRNIHPQRGSKYGFTFGIPKEPYRKFAQYMKLLIDSKFYFIFDHDGVAFYLNDPKLTYKDYFNGKNNIEKVNEKRGEKQQELYDIEEISKRNFPEMRPKFIFKKEAKLEKVLNAIYEENDEKLLNSLERTFLEIRTVPCQRISEIDSPPAFALGIQKNIIKAEKEIAKKPYGFWAKFRENAIRKGLDFEIDGENTSEIVIKFLEIAEEGLENKDKKYLKRTFERVKNRKNLGQENLGIFEKEGLEKMMEKNLLNY